MTSPAAADRLLAAGGMRRLPVPVAAGDARAESGHLAARVALAGSLKRNANRRRAGHAVEGSAASPVPLLAPLGVRHVVFHLRGEMRSVAVLWRTWEAGWKPAPCPARGPPESRTHLGGKRKGISTLRGGVFFAA